MQCPQFTSYLYCDLLPRKIRHSSALLVFVLILNGLHWDLLGLRFCGGYVYGVFINGAAERTDIRYVCLP